MALSGTFQNYPVSSFGLYCEWSGVQSVTGNYTDVTLKVYLSYYTIRQRNNPPGSALRRCRLSCRKG